MWHGLLRTPSALLPSKGLFPRTTGQSVRVSVRQVDSGDSSDSLTSAAHKSGGKEGFSKWFRRKSSTALSMFEPSMSTQSTLDAVQESAATEEDSLAPWPEDSLAHASPAAAFDDDGRPSTSFC